MSTAPRPLAPVPDPGRGPGRRAPDLAPAETLLATRMAALARAQPGPGLRERCLADRPVPLEPALPAGRGRRLLPLAWAALALVAIGLAVLHRSGAALDPRPNDVEAHLLGSVGRLQVVDDPSVPLFHGLESFDRLTPPALAVAGSGRSRGGR